MTARALPRRVGGYYINQSVSTCSRRQKGGGKVKICGHGTKRIAKDALVRGSRGLFWKTVEEGSHLLTFE